MTSAMTGWTQLYANSGLLDTIKAYDKLKSSTRGRIAAVQAAAVAAGFSTRGQDLEMLGYLKELLTNTQRKTT